MHTLETRKKLYEAWKSGKNQSEASRDLTIPRGTVKDYFRKFSTGEYPNWHRGPAQTRLDLLHCGFESHLAYQYSYALGMYLGDGHITEMKRLKNGNSNYRLRIFCDAKYPSIIFRIKAALSSINPSRKVLTKVKDNGSCVVVYTYSNNLVNLFPQHGPGRKHTRKIYLEPWQKKIIDANPKPFVRGLVESDGCRFVNKVGKYSYPSYSFTNKSNDLHLIFSWACGMLGIHTTRFDKNTYVRTKNGVTILDEFVGVKA